MKIIYKVAVSLFLVLIVFSCNNEDDLELQPIAARDRGEELVNSQAIIEEYLETHFYNYEEFANPPAEFDYRIRFDTIAGANSTKTPLMSQVRSKMVADPFVDGVNYTLYYLQAREGLGEKPNFTDIATATYEGIYINKETTASPYTETFDGSNVPINFDLTAVVNGFQAGMIEFNAAEIVNVNGDGSLEAVNSGIGAMFIPSGLAYYVGPPPGTGIPLYAQLIFTFEVYEVQEGDQDGDGILSIIEDLNNNGNENDDDTDGDGAPNYFDADDDGDGRPTSTEIEIDANGVITYPDTDGDGIVDYLDGDS